MNECIVLRFFHESDPLEITSASHDKGIVFANETSAYPIRGRLRVIPLENNDIARAWLKGIRQIEDWAPPAFFVSITQDGNTLRIAGAGTRQPGKNLPPIGYRLAAHMADTCFELSETEFRLKEGESKEIRVMIKEPRRFKPVEDLAAYDPETLAILENPASRLDGLAVFEWLRRPVVRSARKVCLLNCLAKLRALPDPREPLSRHVESVMFAEIDRCAVRAKPDLLPRLAALAECASPVFNRDTGPLDKSHSELKDWLLGAAAGGYELASFRENVGHISMQIVVTDPVHYAELDIDLFNPFIDAISLGGHVVELADARKTNHFDLFDDVPSDFRYYSLA